MSLLGVSLKMETAAAVLRIPQHEITDRRIDGALVTERTPRARSIWRCNGRRN